jgi:DNA helicase II / ATP-dependent DNA helicase PcrA
VGLERKFVIYDDSDQKALLGRIIKARGLDDRAYPPKRVLGAIMAKKREAIAPKDVELTPSFDDTMVDLYRGYEDALKTVNAVDFEDLILHVMRVAESQTPAGAVPTRARAGGSRAEPVRRRRR